MRSIEGGVSRAHSSRSATRSILRKQFAAADQGESALYFYLVRAGSKRPCLWRLRRPPSGRRRFASPGWRANREGVNGRNLFATLTLKETNTRTRAHRRHTTTSVTSPLRYFPDVERGSTQSVLLKKRWMVIIIFTQLKLQHINVYFMII